MAGSKLGFVADENGKEQRYPVEAGIWNLDEDDFLLYAMLCDPIYCAELLGEDVSNREHGGCYTVRDYQYPLFRTDENYAGFTCARSVGKTESIKWRAVTHAFRRIGENLLLTAPELIHLLPLSQAIESKIDATRLTRDFLDVSRGKTGYTHRPFGVQFADGTEIVGRIPRLTGTGVKGQHQPDLLIDEGQDYPEKGWTEVHETVLKDHVDIDGNPDFVYHFYGVHSGARDTGFHRRATKGFKIVQITAIQRPGWGSTEKQAAIAAYGGSQASDYRRNILGEAGGAASPLFITARLMACVDQGPKNGQPLDSPYNAVEVQPRMMVGEGGMWQQIRVEEFDELGLPIEDVIDLPPGLKNVWVGGDLGLTQSPTVFTIWTETVVNKVPRLKLIRRIHLERMRTKHIRRALYAMAGVYGDQLKGVGIDITGLGFPIFQEMEDDEHVPPRLKEVLRGYFFNARVPVGVDKTQVTKDEAGRLRDALGNTVVAEVDPLTNHVRYVLYMPMIEASTRYLRKFVDDTFMLLPFDAAVTGDMQGETEQRLKRIAGLKNKPNAFHILDSMRAMAMVYHAETVERELEFEEQVPVLDMAL